MNKEKAIGYYPLDGIKYFNPYNLEIHLNCPHCEKQDFIDLGSDFIEYPKEYQEITLECEQCKKEYILKLGIELIVEVEYEVYN